MPATEKPQPKQKVLVVIPARLESTRLPRKLLLDLHGKTVLRRTYDATLRAINCLNKSPIVGNEFETTLVISSSDREILDHAESFGATVHSSGTCDSGTERCHEAAKSAIAREDNAAQIVVNVQADEPFLPFDALTALLRPFAFLGDQSGYSKMSTLWTWDNANLCRNPSVVTLVTDQYDKCLYFSRSLIPYVPEFSEYTPVKRHIGVYAYTRSVLTNFAARKAADRCKSSSRAQSQFHHENLEQLDFLYHDVEIQACQVACGLAIGINTQEDYEQALLYAKAADNKTSN